MIVRFASNFFVVDTIEPASQPLLLKYMRDNNQVGVEVKVKQACMFRYDDYTVVFLEESDIGRNIIINKEIIDFNEGKSNLNQFIEVIHK